MSSGQGEDVDPGAQLRSLVASAHDLTVTLSRRLELGVTDFRALDVLLERGPTGPNELGSRLGLTPPAATALADRLEAAGHVRRIRDPDDRRRVTLAPTEHARSEAQRVVMPFVRDVIEAVGELSAGERAAVVRFLSRVLEIQRRHAGEEDPPAPPG